MRQFGGAEHSFPILENFDVDVFLQILEKLWIGVVVRVASIAVQYLLPWLFGCRPRWISSAILPMSWISKHRFVSLLVFQLHEFFFHFWRWIIVLNRPLFAKKFEDFTQKHASDFDWNVNIVERSSTTTWWRWQSTHMTFHLCAWTHSLLMGWHFVFDVEKRN